MAVKRDVKKSASRKTLKAKAWKLFSEYVRRKHADANGYATCYTSGVKAHWKELQCGHAIPGRHNAVLFDEEICRPQTAAENVWKRGNYPVFTTKLIKEKGMDWWDKKLEESNRQVKLPAYALLAIIDEFTEKLKRLETA